MNHLTTTQLPKGFLAAGINCGVRRYRPDLGIIISEIPSIGCGVFTKNTCKAAPILYCQELLPSTTISAIITNSGQANAATGEQGKFDNQKMVDCVAQHLGCAAQQILAASTGVIGEPLCLDKITQAIPELIKNASTVSDKFALAILTTDLVPKTVSKTVELSAGSIHITGICKGSGMIHPNMGTMLGYLLTDAKLSVNQTQKLLRDATECSFNMISVDGETSTNDCVFMLANGASKVGIESEADYILLDNACREVAILLAKSIAKDGEGATKLIEVKVCQAPCEQQAKQIARSLTVGPLLKSAVYGESPNWGRVLARLGQEQVEPQLLQACSITFQGQLVFSQGSQQAFDREALKTAMKSDLVSICIDFAAGEQQATAWGCDLSERYVKINAEYVT